MPVRFRNAQASHPTRCIQRGANKKRGTSRVARPSLFQYFRCCLERNSTAGACVCTRAALSALLGVNRILLALGDSSNGAFVDTCAASNTVITNYVSHSSTRFLKVYTCFLRAKITNFSDSGLTFPDKFPLVTKNSEKACSLSTLHTDSNGRYFAHKAPSSWRKIGAGLQFFGLRNR